MTSLDHLVTILDTKISLSLYLTKTSGESDTDRLDLTPQS